MRLNGMMRRGQLFDIGEVAAMSGVDLNSSMRRWKLSETHGYLQCTGTRIKTTAT